MSTPPDADALRDAVRRSHARMGRVVTVVSEQPNWFLRLLIGIFVLMAVLFVLLVILPVAILFGIVLFTWSFFAGLLGRARRRMEGRGRISTREGRKNVRVIRR